MSIHSRFAPPLRPKVLWESPWSPTPCRRSERRWISSNLVAKSLPLPTVGEAGTLAGAHLDMASAVRNAVRLAQISLEDALRAASLTPAKFLAVDNERGA